MIIGHDGPRRDDRLHRSSICDPMLAHPASPPLVRPESQMFVHKRLRPAQVFL
jgi:hypothetical protein